MGRAGKHSSPAISGLMGRGKLISSHPFPPVTFSPAVFPRKLRVSALVVFCPPRRRMGDGTAPHRRDNSSSARHSSLHWWNCGRHQTAGIIGTDNSLFSLSLFSSSAVLSSRRRIGAGDSSSTLQLSPVSRSHAHPVMYPVQSFGGRMLL